MSTTLVIGCILTVYIDDRSIKPENLLQAICKLFDALKKFIILINPLCGMTMWYVI